MNILEKASVLSKAGHFDSCGPKMCEVNVNKGLGGIYHAKAEHKTCKIFKTLMDNNCSFDCKYCSNSNHCKKKKAQYEPKELANLFNFMHKKLDVNGLFISSAVNGNPDKVTRKMIDAVTIVRKKYHYKGYVHFKALPGTSYELMKQASELSNRMSINIEAPNKSVLKELSSCKDYKNDLLKRQRWIKNFKLGSGQVTQMIINNMSTDKEVLKTMNYEYNEMKLKRVYYSAFQPIKGTPLENYSACDKKRETHLYNVDFLVRGYNYKIKEFDSIFDNGMLPKIDPKLALAKANFDSPLDINEANFKDLIKIPGIGPKTAVKIVHHKTKISSYNELNKFGVFIKRAKPFIKVNGKRQKMLTEF
ncbi:radical SAM protein [archaeon]|jgi:predicted DNA-binding helix-hairpin-helix protein|nr:radical SAM protein [archaeon]MBT4022828.1 radical SAM protein [archaeon]MBT4272978.1 radical SAM protein [archaeon]MBT4460931.1 radical SAM protein [archaeon]MBT4858041.1 radical SAM protein [archaeon]